MDPTAVDYTVTEEHGADDLAETLAELERSIDSLEPFKGCESIDEDDGTESINSRQFTATAPAFATVNRCLPPPDHH